MHGQRSIDRALFSLLAGHPGAAAAYGMLPMPAANFAVAGMAAAQQAVNTASTVMNITSNSSTTADEQNRGLGRAFGMGFMIDFMDAIDGTTERMRKLGEELRPSELAKQRVAFEQREAQHQFGREAFGINTRAQIQGAFVAGRSGAAFDYQFHDLKTVQSERAAEHQDRIKPLEIAKERAEREARAAQNELNNARFGTSEAQRNLALAQEVANRARGRADAATNPADRAEKLFQLELAQNEVLQRSEEVQKRLTEQKETGVRAVQAESDARQGLIAIQREELTLMKEREARMGNRAAAVGRMTGPERTGALVALRGIEKRGLAGATPRQRERARMLAPDYIRKLEQARGDEFMEKNNLWRLDEADGKSRSQVIADRQKLQLNINMAADFDADAVAKKLAENLSGLLNAMNESFRVKAKTEAEKVQTTQQMQNANNSVNRR